MEKGFLKVDFTLNGNFKKYNKSIKKYILKSKRKNILIIDYIYPLTRLRKDKYQISDHINLSGENPLCGPQFLSLTNIYNKHSLGDQMIVIGLKEGIEPNKNEKKILLKAKAKAYCYNLIPTVILSRSLGLEIKAIGVIKNV